MSRAFLAASSEYLNTATTPVTARPLTLACWFNADNVTTGNALFGIYDVDDVIDWYALEARGDVGGDPVRARVSASGSHDYAVTTTGFSANTWHHACGVFTSASDTAAFIDGGSEGNNNPGLTAANLDAINIGRHGDSTPSNYADASICECAIWNVALTNAEVAMLATGLSPLQVRPASLVFYAPLIRDEDRDIVQGRILSAGGTPTIDTHARVFYPKHTGIISGAAAAPPVGGRIMSSLTKHGGLAGKGGIAGIGGGLAG